MKQLFEIEKAIELINLTRRANLYAKLKVQALQWSRLRINHDPDEAEVLIRARIAKLEEIQDKKEIMGFATKTARAFQINALKWVVDEGEI